MEKIKIGLIGLGTVGTGVVRALREKKSLLSEKLGVEIELARICEKNLRAKRDVALNRKILTRHVGELLSDPKIQIVVELIGGVHPARELVLRALKAGKHVVTANKHLLALHKREIFARAQRKGVDIRFEASVGGGIPIIKALREGLIANRVKSLYGIINGTSNYILSRMSEAGCEFRDALKEAQRLGYAERNAAFDIKGLDSAHKLAILASLGFGRDVRLKDIYVEGIEDVSPGDVIYARGLGYRIKLLAIAKREGSELEVRVHPTLISRRHLLSRVSGADNAVYVRGDLSGELLLYGPGAGQLPAASAVVSDIVDIVRQIKSGATKSCVSELVNWKDRRVRRIRKIGEIQTRFYIRFMTLDRPGVLAQISRILARHRISIASVIQKEKRRARIVPIIMMTHGANERSAQLALSEIDKLPVVKRRSVAIRIASL